MNAQWMKLAGELLELASDEFANHGCNDWEFPTHWTLKEKQELVKAMHDANGTPEEYDPKRLQVPDWWVMSFLAKRLMEVQP